MESWMYFAAAAITGTNVITVVIIVIMSFDWEFCQTSSNTKQSKLLKVNILVIISTCFSPQSYMLP